MKSAFLLALTGLTLFALGCVEEKKKEPASTDGTGSGGGGGTSPSVALESASKKFHFTINQLATRFATTPVFASFPTAGSPSIDSATAITSLAEPADPAQNVDYNTTRLGTIGANVQTSIDQSAASRSHTVLVDTDATTCTSSIDLTCTINSMNPKQLDLTSIVMTGFTTSTTSLPVTISGTLLNPSTVVNTYSRAQNHDTTYNQRLAKEAVALGDYIYFNGWNVIGGSETTALFRVHKATLDTEVILNANPGYGTKADTSHLTAFNGALYFRARVNGLSKYRLIKFDPSNSTLSQISSDTLLLNPRNFHVYNNNMYFFAENSSSLTKLYKMNSSGAIKQLTDLCATASEAGLKMLSTNTGLYVSLISPTRCNDGVKRWIISRINSDDSLTALLYYDSGSSFLIDDGLREIVLYSSKNHLNIGASGILYRDDGNQFYRAINYDVFGRGTTPVASMSVVNGYLYYKTADSPTADGLKVFRYDGATEELRQLNVDNLTPDVKLIRSFNNKLYVAMKNSAGNHKLYQLDAHDNLIRISDLSSSSGDDIVTSYTYNDELYFLAQISGGSYRVHKISADHTLHQVTSSALANTNFLLGTPLGLVLTSDGEDAIRLVQ